MKAVSSMLFDIDCLDCDLHAEAPEKLAYVGQVASVQRLVREAADAVSQVGDVSCSLGLGLLGTKASHECRSSHGVKSVGPSCALFVGPRCAHIDCCLASGAFWHHQPAG
jgi:hypothetical protein